MSRVKFSSLSQADLERYLEDLSLSAASDPGIQVVEVTVPESEVQSVMEVAKEAARRCEELSSSAKVKYEKMAADDKLRYEKEKHNFDGDRGQDDGSDLINNDDQHEQPQNTVCKVCNQSPCLSGQFLTENIKDLVGLRVKATGDSWADSKHRNVRRLVGELGTVVSYKHSKVNNFINILWERKKAKPRQQQQYTYLAKGKPKFTIECQPHIQSFSSAATNDLPVESQSHKNSHDFTTLQNDVEDESEDDDSFTMLSTPGMEIVDIEDDMKCHDGPDKDTKADEKMKKRRMKRREKKKLLTQRPHSYNFTAPLNDIEDESEADDSFTMLSTPGTQIVDIEDELEEPHHDIRDKDTKPDDKEVLFQKLREQAAEQLLYLQRLRQRLHQQLSRATRHRLHEQLLQFLENTSPCPRKGLWLGQLFRHVKGAGIKCNISQLQVRLLLWCYKVLPNFDSRTGLIISA